MRDLAHVTRIACRAFGIALNVFEIMLLYFCGLCGPHVTRDWFESAPFPARYCARQTQACAFVGTSDVVSTSLSFYVRMHNIRAHNLIRNIDMRPCARTDTRFNSMHPSIHPMFRISIHVGDRETTTCIDCIGRPSLRSAISIHANIYPDF